jgi:hypothetical protein
MSLSLSVKFLPIINFKMKQRLNSCSTFCFESEVMSCNHIIVHTPQKLSAVFVTFSWPSLLSQEMLACYFPADTLSRVFSISVCPLYSCFLLFSSEYCSDNSKIAFSNKLKLQMNFENSFFSLSFGTVSRIISIHAAQVLVFPQSLKRIHYPLKTQPVFRNWQLRDWVQVLSSWKSSCTAWS